MTTKTNLYTLNYNEARTYLWTAVFVVCNLLLPQVCHLLPQGGVILSPLSLVIMVGAYKFGWRAGLLAAVVSPLVNHLATGLPAWGILQVMTVKLMILTLISGFTAQYFRKVTIPLLIGVVLATKVLGGLGELALTGGIETTVADVTIGWPSMLIQIAGTYLICKFL